VRKIVKIFIDLDGTICGDGEWHSWIASYRLLLSTGILNKSIPPNHSWNILTARPKIDRFVINRALKKYKLFPEEVITSPTWFYHFDGKESEANWKFSVLSMEADNMFVDKVVYVDDDPEILSNIMKHRNIILCRPETLNKVLEELEEE